MASPEYASPPNSESIFRLSNLLLDLHRASVDIHAAAFQDWALARLRKEIPFDSAMWATGAGSDYGPTFHGVHLCEQPQQMLSDYEPLKSQDVLFAECLATPGRALRAAARTELPTSFQDYNERYGLRQALCTMTIDPSTALVTGVSLYRSDADNAFTLAEAQLMEAVFEHLIEAYSRSNLARLKSVARTDMRDPWTFAACDRDGRLRFADKPFTHAMLAQWPYWQGPELPSELIAAITNSGTVVRVGSSSAARATPLGDIVLLQLRTRGPLDELPPRLRDVALLAIRGASHKEIATALGVTPTTARNQLANLYRRLKVHNKTALAALLANGDAASE